MRKILILITIFLILILNISYFLTVNSVKDLKHVNPKDLTKKHVALVLGAGVWEDNKPSPILEDRIDSGILLLKMGIVDKLVMSGDNRFEWYDEPTSMMNYAKEMGVEEKYLQPDYAGRRTYDSCKRIKEIFSQDDYCNPRLHMIEQYIRVTLGVKTEGFLSDRDKYPCLLKEDKKTTKIKTRHIHLKNFKDDSKEVCKTKEEVISLLLINKMEGRMYSLYKTFIDMYYFTSICRGEKEI
jgi:hypothetical protein